MERHVDVAIIGAGDMGRRHAEHWAASGARVVVTLLNALTHRDKARGVAALCIGGGEATALAIERL